MKKAIKIFALILSSILIIVSCVIADICYGNPISKAIAKQSAKRHIEENHSGEGYYVEKVTYDSWYGVYYAEVTSKSHIDGDFVIEVSRRGKVTRSHYESSVTSHFNVANRVSGEYAKIVDGVLTSEDFPYTISVGYGHLNFVYASNPDAVDEFCWADLENDKIYDVRELAIQNGRLVLYIDSDTITLEKAAEILLKVRELMDKASVPFNLIQLHLQHLPYDSLPPGRPNGEIVLVDFPYTDIYVEGMLERVREQAIVNE